MLFAFKQFLKQTVITSKTIPATADIRLGNNIDRAATLATDLAARIIICNPILMGALGTLESNHFNILGFFGFCSFLKSLFLLSIDICSNAGILWQKNEKKQNYL